MTRFPTQLVIAFLCLWLPVQGAAADQARSEAQIGPRPFFLVDAMRESDLKTALQQCESGPFHRNDFTIGHRGAPLVYPEHTRQSYMAAARMGAGIVECDVAFTSDRELVCRHSQCDLHDTTDILDHPDIAAQCRQPFVPADRALGADALVECCTSDITLEQFRRLRGKHETADPSAMTASDYMSATPEWLKAPRGEVMTHRDSIALLSELGIKMTPELKIPQVDMPFEGAFSQEDYARRMIEDYIDAGIAPEDVYPQSFRLADVEFWIEHYPDYGARAVYLDGRYSERGFDHADPQSWEPSMEALAERGVNIIAPPLWMLVAEGDEGRIIPSVYAERARAAGLEIIAWTLERSGSLASGGGWYYRTIEDIVSTEGDVMELIHVLAQDVGVKAVFTDWAGTTTFYASCMGLD